MNCCGGLARFSSPTNQSVNFQTLRVNPAWLSGRLLRHLGATLQPYAPDECKWCTNETAARSILAQWMSPGAGEPGEDDWLASHRGYKAESVRYSSCAS